MSNTGTAAASKPGEPRYLPWISVVVLWALVQVVALAVGTSPVLEGNLIGTDAYMRLVRVELLHETGAWFDGGIPRSNAPYGDILHWTRPLDVLLLGAAWLVTPFLGFEKALFWAGSFVSPALLLASAFAMMWAARPLIDAECRPYVMVAFLVQVAVQSYALPGRIDHHVLQILLFVLTIGLMLRLTTGDLGKVTAFLAGATQGVGLWVSIEFTLIAVLSTAMIWIMWLRDGGKKTSLSLAYAAGLALSVALALLIERPLGEISAEEYDRLSIVHFVIVLIHLCLWVLIWLDERARGKSPSSGGRSMFALLGALASSAAIYVIYPKYFGGPRVDIDPALIPVWDDKVAELQSILPIDAKSLGRFLLWVGMPAVCLPFVVTRLWFERRSQNWMWWLYCTLGLGLYFTLAVLHARFAPFAEVMAVVPLVYLMSLLFERVKGIKGELPRGLARSFISLFLLVGISGSGLLFGFTPFADARGAVAQRANASSANASSAHAGGKCDLRAVADFLNRPDGLGARRHTIVSHIDYGPELLYRTEHAVVGSPYHRNGPGILDTYRFFTAASDADGKARLDERGIDLVLLCPSPSEAEFFSTETETVTLYQRLLLGRIPNWLRPIDLPVSLATGARLYEVVRD